ncbi:hypothetical protein Tco_0487900 [Tanacetum coccineum]
MILRVTTAQILLSIWGSNSKWRHSHPQENVDGVEQQSSITAEEKLARKNELKERGTLLMALPNEHHLKFNTYKCAKTLMDAIEKRSAGLQEENKNRENMYGECDVLQVSSSSDIENLDIMLRDNALTELRKKFEKAKKERDDLKLTLEKFGNSSKNLSKLLEIQVSDKFKTSVGFDYQVVDSHVFDSQENERYKTSKGYHAVPPLYTRNFMPPKYDLILADEGRIFLVSH